MANIAFTIDYFNQYNALGKVVLSFCRELKASYNIETIILAVYASTNSTRNLPEGVTVKPISVADSMSIGQLAYMDYFLHTIGRKLSRLVECTPADCYIHIPSAGHSISRARRTAPLGYFSHGEIFGCFFSEPWYQKLTVPTPLKLLMRLAAPFILSETTRQFRHYDFFLANSHFTKEQLYLLTGFQARRVYLPVDIDVFIPVKNENKEKYLFVAGHPREIEVDTIIELAQKTHVVYAGHQPIPHCDNRGYVSEQELIQLYSGAIATIFPHHHEEYGMIPVESMACGTPVLTYDYQGPGETVLDRVTGWTVDTQAQLVEKGEEVFRQGVTTEMRQHCREHVLNNFSPNVCTHQLLDNLVMYIYP